MKNLLFSSLDYDDFEKLKVAKTADDFIIIFKGILQSLYCEDCFLESESHHVQDNLAFLFGFNGEESFPTKGENMRFYPSSDAYLKIEKNFQKVEKYKALLNRPHSLCGRWKIRRKINKLDYEMSAQELYSAVIYLFLHRGLGTIADFKSLITAK